MIFQIILVTFINALLYIECKKCPKKLPLEIEGNCYKLETKPLRFTDAVDNCQNIDENAVLTSVRSEVVLNRIEELIYEFITSKLENALFWIGFYTEDKSFKKAAKHRNWKWSYDDTEIIQKDFALWDEDGGPTDTALTCSTINASNNFLVMPVDCGAARLPVICMMKEGEKCKHDVAPYLTYGDYCLASINGALEYYKIGGACSPHAPTPYKNEEMKKYVTLAAINSFLGGGVFMNMKREGDKFIELYDEREPDEDWWEDGEPRDQYDCVGLSVQLDNSLKYKTINCDFLAASLCAYRNIPITKIHMK